MIRQSPVATDLSASLATDVKGMGALRQQAKEGSPEALKGAAKQFEAMFLNMVMKSMRDATPQDGMMDSQQTKTFTAMLDQQTSQNLANKGVGLADVLVRQLSQTQNAQALKLGDESLLTGQDGTSALAAQRLQKALEAVGGMDAKTALTPEQEAARAGQAPHVRAFQDKLGSHADEASKTTGIPAKFMLGQAALESGWGRREIKGRDGTNSHNLFGIKAGSDWKGKTVQTVTTEYVNGVAQRKVERFRAYDSYAESFKDYAKLLSSNPRYEKVLANAGDATKFAQGLQRAGYATDPNYAAKLTSIIKRSLV
ncbi:flagellar assembly peptidoglycan hydrolase FlgJ [Pseudoduganella ginsengisoli]|uniref:Peptidoglycan hydrolase FlgJ n=1 Tax=Pseudoduganella ginsengisoli TaxID=1462440 RepID=A0A6L6PTA7_9BURK|nr:flagellar assembly peptidoglycan hydrolase FlgJ [Pseudoduganella ginsengisoli]MTW00471.1 flagellar assembly peptidoglycan hydrolase FlgJ [Pseudoduganella ginsengisoli]